jgi:hypothetical protein
VSNTPIAVHRTGSLGFTVRGEDVIAALRVVADQFDNYEYFDQDHYDGGFFYKIGLRAIARDNGSNDDLKVVPINSEFGFIKPHGDYDSLLVVSYARIPDDSEPYHTVSNVALIVRIGEVAAALRKVLLDQHKPVS